MLVSRSKWMMPAGDMEIKSSKVKSCDCASDITHPLIISSVSSDSSLSLECPLDCKSPYSEPTL
ncbi:hypothetical protein D3C77_674340 [compost metagenome]